jgi:hypothetical protein
MRVTPEHKIILQGEGGEEFPEINDPVYLYNIGDRFMMYFFDEETEQTAAHEFEVTDIKHEVHSIIDCEQRVVINVKRVE